MTDIVFKSVTQLVAAIKSKKLSSAEIVEAYLTQISRINPKINAIMQVDAERITKEAKAADELLAKGKITGPLHGIPVSIKDNIATKDIISTIGVKELLNNIPGEDATVVSRLKNAGAIILGKTNMPDFAMSWDTESSAYGLTKNPYNLDRSSGGSSGGEAALIAAGGSPCGLGNDGGGSIRVPAHYCGIAGLRPSIGMIPSTGCMPPAQGSPLLGLWSSLATIGPMARYVDDLALLLPILAGPDLKDPNTIHREIPDLVAANYPNLRIAFYTSDAKHEPINEIQQAVLNVAHSLEKLSYSITEQCPPDINKSFDLFYRLTAADGGEGFDKMMQDINPRHTPDYSKYTLEKWRQTGKLDVSDFMLILIEWDMFRIAMQNYMQNFDIIIAPVLPDIAPTHDKPLNMPSNDLGVANYLVHYSLLGWPCAVVRIGTSKNGMPIGVQIIAKHWHDHLVIHVARLLEQEFGGWQAPQL